MSTRVHQQVPSPPTSTWAGVSRPASSPDSCPERADASGGAADAPIHWQGLPPVGVERRPHLPLAGPPPSAGRASRQEMSARRQCGDRAGAGETGPAPPASRQAGRGRRRRRRSASWLMHAIRIRERAYAYALRCGHLHTHLERAPLDILIHSADLEGPAAPTSRWARRRRRRCRAGCPAR